jgi:protein subunit release factor A
MGEINVGNTGLKEGVEEKGRGLKNKDKLESGGPRAQRLGIEEAGTGRIEARTVGRVTMPYFRG